MGNNSCYIFAGGGSGGHLYPGLAVASVLRKMQPGAEILFLATEREIDRRILSASGFEFVAQPIVPLPRRPMKVWDFYQRWRKSCRLCRDLFQQRQTQVVLGLGGYASGAALKTAARVGIPAAMLNPDALPGKANRFAMPLVRKIFLQWLGSTECFGRFADRCVVTGCPIRDEFNNPALLQSDRESMLKAIGLVTDKKTLLVMAGSQGGHNVNRAVVRLFTDEQFCNDNQAALADWQILHLSGADQEDWVRQQYQSASVAGAVLDFAEQMPKLLMAADLVISRAGASSLAELTALAKPAVLIPYPYHRDQHQMKNAQVLAQTGAARIVIDQCDEQKTSRNLGEVLQGLFQHNAILDEMAAAAAKLARPDAAQDVAEELIFMTDLVS
ncbi:MAG: UDP-N-acetylglucosamine--N-acetylmuramyl-(pentapeptide) pyrophosphoryl-undecaprenol N-acetylglucosamine transferase [Sedimentisphaerales bacterium]|nr:UDP-N-acetylglucosamine--N-acetylmuramyl-(pentapeptide) pyrophosphoryl-undecaprenol N-acetylglucosamine transferase [Sedimentisphaerales bacterium]